MKKYFILLGATLGLFALASCQKEVDILTPENNANNHIPFALNAEIVETRTTLDASSWQMAWAEGDVIYAVTTDGLWGLPYSQDTPGESIADFTYSGGSFTTDLEIEDGKHTFNFLYTANESQRSYHRSAATTFNLAASQTEDASSPTAALNMNDVLAGQVTATTPTTFVNVPMDHLFTLMRVTLKNKTGEAITINRFEISATDATLAGIFTVTFGNSPSITLKSGGKDYVSVDITNGEIAADGELPVYFVMAPLSNYSGDITFTAEDVDGVVYTKTNTVSAVSFEAGKYNTANFSLKGTPTMILDPETLEPFSKDGGSQTITVTTKQFAGTPTITATTDNSVFEASVSEDNVVTVSVASHTTDAETGILTITAAYGTQVVTKTVDLRQESGLSYADKTFFMETFGGTDSSLGTGAADFAADNEGWDVTKGYLAGADGHSARFGSGSEKGIATTPEIVVKNGSFDYSGADLKLTFKAAAWSGNSEKTELKVSASGASLSGDALSGGVVTTKKGEWTDYELTISGFTGSSFTLTFEGVATSNARFFLDEVYVYYGSTPKLNPGISFEKENVNAIIGEEFTAPSLINPNNVSVVYSSSDISVAEVNSSTGTVTIKSQTVGATATITASFAGNDTFASATASYTITLAEKPKGATVTMETFTTISGYVDDDENVSYAAAKGTAGTAPAVNGGQIRVYQNGGLFTVTANNNTKIKSITLGSAMATTVDISVDGVTTNEDVAIAENATITKDGITATSVQFTCKGTDKYSRLYVNYLSVTYE